MLGAWQSMSEEKLSASACKIKLEKGQKAVVDTCVKCEFRVVMAKYINVLMRFCIIHFIF